MKTKLVLFSLFVLTTRHGYSQCVVYSDIPIAKWNNTAVTYSYSTDFGANWMPVVAAARFG